MMVTYKNPAPVGFLFGRLLIAYTQGHRVKSHERGVSGAIAPLDSPEMIHL